MSLYARKKKEALVGSSGEPLLEPMNAAGYRLGISDT